MLDPASVKSLPVTPVVNMPMLPTVVPEVMEKLNGCEELAVPMACEPKFT